jgi:hypothetical protein
MSSVERQFLTGISLSSEDVDMLGEGGNPWAEARFTHRWQGISCLRLEKVDEES